jgi:hypothetical protein
MPWVDLLAYERWLAERDEAVLLAEERIVRRVIKRERRIAGLGLRVPHARCLVVTRATLLACATPQELGLDRALPSRVILVARPAHARGPQGAADGEHLGAADEAPARAVARALFHARVHAALERAPLDEAALRARAHAIGEAEYDEIRRVLEQDDHLLPLVDDDGAPRTPAARALAQERAIWVELAALWLELGRFAPAVRRATFPGLLDAASVERVDRIVAEGLDVDALLEASCPPELLPREESSRDLGTASSALRSSGVRAPAAERVLAEVARAQRLDPAAATRLRDQAAAARASGNVVRAALLGLEAVHLSAEEDRAPLLAQARADVDALIARLDAAVDRAGDGALAGPLLALAHVAARPSLGGDLAVQLGPAARVLYDLQNAAIAHERELRKVDVAAWAASFGKRPIVRSLAPARELRVARQVRAAQAKLALVHATGDDAGDLRALRRALHALSSAADASVRRALGPKLGRVLDEVGLKPSSLPEEVARTKLVDELIDLALAHGHLHLGQLRDAFSRNDLKLPNLRGPHELVFDDPLLRADRRLSIELDGVYRRGEIYLRWLQKLSSLLFGTATGRFLTLFAILPVLAAFVLLEGAQHLLHPLLGLMHVHWHPHLMGPISLPITAVVIFGLLHSAAVRKIGGQIAGAIGFLFAAIFFRLPLAFAQLPLVRKVLRSEPMALFRRHVLRPTLLGLLAWLVLPELGEHGRTLWHSEWVAQHGAEQRFELPRAHVFHLDRWGGLAVGLAAFVLFLTKYGSAAEEMALDYAVRSFRHLRTRVLPGVIKAIADVFRAMVEGSERLLYAVDERLRFGRGERAITIVAKGAAGLVFGFFAFWVRIYVNLLIEPQVNPIKHFPVVTVSHKITLPLAPQIVHALVLVLRPLGRFFATAFATITVLLIPGVFGFLAWEFKENFRLYRAAREGRLRPSPIGHHGETMAGLLKPGFHSGTIPKLSGKIRRAARLHPEQLPELAAQRLEIEEAIERFVVRELCALLARAPQWRLGAIEVAHVELGGNRVRVSLRAPQLSAGDAVIAFEEQSGFIVAGLSAAGFVDALDDEARRVFEAALAGLYARASVDLVREQLEAELITAVGAAGEASEQGAPPYDVADDGLLVWPSGDYAQEVVYRLDGEGWLAPRVPDGATVAARPIQAERAIFARQSLVWRAWNEAWTAKTVERSPLALDGGGPAPSILPPRRGAAPAATIGDDDAEGRSAAR